MVGSSAPPALACMVMTSTDMAMARMATMRTGMIRMLPMDTIRTVTTAMLAMGMTHTMITPTAA